VCSKKRCAMTKLTALVLQNLRKVVQFALPTNMAQGCCIIVALLIGIETPLNAIQVLTVNMVCSVTLGIVIALGT
jgi:cation-transporting ATPase F